MVLRNSQTSIKCHQIRYFGKGKEKEVDKKKQEVDALQHKENKLEEKGEKMVSEGVVKFSSGNQSDQEVAVGSKG